MFKPKSEEKKTPEEKDTLEKLSERILTMENILKQFITTTDKRLKAVEQAAQKPPVIQTPTIPPTATPPTPKLLSPQPLMMGQTPVATPKPASELPSISEGVVQKFISGIENVTKVAEKLTQISTALQGYIKDLTDAQAANTSLLAKVEERLEAVGKALTGLSKGRGATIPEGGEVEESPVKKVLDKLHKDLEKEIADALQEKTKSVAKEITEKYKGKTL